MIATLWVGSYQHLMKREQAQRLIRYELDRGYKLPNKFWGKVR